jgi:virginiamycin A acetyltransferase
MSHSKVMPNFVILNKVEKIKQYPEIFDIGDHTYGCPTITIAPGIKVKIGKYCSIAHNVFIEFNGHHRINSISTYPFELVHDLWPQIEGKEVEKPNDRKTVTIGNDVWIGAGAQILGGATIGDGAIIGARAVIAGNVPPYAIVIGNPAKVLRYRFTAGQIRNLLNIKWWEWSDEKVNQNVELICGNNIDEFIQKFGG